MRGFLHLTNSRKAAAALAMIVVAAVLLATGQIDGDTAANMIGGAIVALMATIAWEDVAQKKGASNE